MRRRRESKKEKQECRHCQVILRYLDGLIQGCRSMAQDHAAVTTWLEQLQLEAWLITAASGVHVSSQLVLFNSRSSTLFKLMLLGVCACVLCLTSVNSAPLSLRFTAFYLKYKRTAYCMLVYCKIL